EEQGRSLSERFTALGERERAATIALESEEAQVEVRRNALYEQEAQLEAARGQLSEATLAVDRHQGRSGYCREQIAETDTRATAERSEADELQAGVGPLAETLEARRAEAARLTLELQQAEADAAAAEAAVRECAARQAAAEAEQEAGRDAQVAMLGRIAALQNA